MKCGVPNPGGAGGGGGHHHIAVNAHGRAIGAAMRRLRLIAGTRRRLGTLHMGGMRLRRIRIVRGACTCARPQKGVHFAPLTTPRHTPPQFPSSCRCASPVVRVRAATELSAVPRAVGICAAACVRAAPRLSERIWGRGVCREWGGAERAAAAASIKIRRRLCPLLIEVGRVGQHAVVKMH